MDSHTKFSFDTIKEFDTHIDLSIPNYSNLQNAIERIATYYLKPGSRIYDLGCSTGLLLNRLSALGGSGIEFIGFDNTLNLLSMLPKKDGIELIYADFDDQSFKLDQADLIFSVFTLQFLSPETRRKLVDLVWNALPQGGAFIVSEKQYINDGYIQDLFTFAHYDMKLKYFGAEEILSKQLELRKIMRPYSEDLNLNLLSKFSSVVPFWQFLNFKAYLCIK